MEFNDGRITLKGLEKLREVVNATENPIKYLAIDPGKHNGICGYDSRYYVQFMYTIHEADVMQFLRCFDNVELVVIENYKLYPNKAKHQSYSDMLTPRVIERVNIWCEDNNIHLEKQMATVKDTGYKWAGKNPLPKSNAMNHALDAHIHFVYWAVKSGRMNAKDLLR